MIFSPTNYSGNIQAEKLLNKMQEQTAIYSSYWWKRRPLSGSYVELKQDIPMGSAYGDCDIYNHALHGVTSTSYHLHVSIYRHDQSKDAEEFATLSYSNKININQSTGAISLSNPSTLTINSTSDITSSIYSTLRGKYVTGFIGQAKNTVYYIPVNSSGVDESYMHTDYSSDKYGTEISINSCGYVVTDCEYENSNNQATAIKLVTSKISSSGSTWELISSDNSDTYPKSGENSGYQWIYLGKISDAALNPTQESKNKWTTINVTTASFAGSQYMIKIPASMALVYIKDTNGYNGYRCWGIIDTDNAKAYGLSIYGSDPDVDLSLDSETLGKLSGGTAVAVIGGMKLQSSGSTGFACTISYLPLF